MAAPPDQPRFIYEAVLRNSQSIARESDEDRLRRLLTGIGEDARSFKKPLAVAARGGRIYVTDTEGRRVHVFDVPRRRFWILTTRCGR